MQEEEEEEEERNKVKTEDYLAVDSVAEEREEKEDEKLTSDVGG